MTVAVLGLYEGYWRLRGVSANVFDDHQVWALTRAGIRPNDPDEIVLLGASRIQVGLDLEEMARAFAGRRPVQLAMSGSVWGPVLEHLSADPTFCGVAVCEYYSGMLSGRCNLASQTAQAEAVRCYDERSAGALLEYRLRLWCSPLLVSRRVELGLSNLLDHVRKGQWPRPQSAWRMLPDRSVQLDFRQEERKAPPQYVPTGVVATDPQQVRATLALWGLLAERIRARGGKVVFVKMPVSGHVRAFEDDCFPRATEWDVLAAQPWAITLHYADYPALAYYHCPDGGHLDYRDAVPFTQAFAALLKAKLYPEK